MDRKTELFERGERVAKVGFAAVAFMGAVKGVVGWSSGSISLLAQAVDSLTDLISLVAVYAGMRLSRRPPSERFTYGYYRVETLVSLVISVIILLTGGGMLLESWSRVSSPVPVSDPLLVALAAGLSVPALLALNKYTERVGSEINSQAVMSQAADFRADVYSSVVVLAGAAASWLGYPVLEGVAGVVISLLVVRVGAGLAWQGLLVLMDAVEHPDRLLEVKRLAEEVRGVAEATDVRMRRSGPFCLGEITIRVDQRLPVEQAHRLSHEVENRVREGVPSLESLVVHVEPGERSHHKIAVPVALDGGLGSTVSPHFGTAPFFMFVDVGEAGAERWYTRGNPALGAEKGRGKAITDFLLGEEVTALLADEVGEGPFHILRDSYVGVYRINGGSVVGDAIDGFVGGTLPVHDGGSGRLGEEKEVAG
ncbi:cation diffusion facilitator family transporter [Candidatus Bathyarchaeota archaeon]|nr:cation diffusion facilitator family transporter [Candidatus Bathyarchaeota archaeon]